MIWLLKVCLLSERRKCPVCKTKWKVKFLGKIELSSYFCEKCGIVHSHLIGPLEFFEIPEKFRYLMTIADCDELLGSLAHRKPMTLKDLEKRWRRIDEESSTMPDIFIVLASHYTKVCYNSPCIRILRILDNDKWLSKAEIGKEYGSKYIDQYLNITCHWFLTNKAKQGRKFIYKIAPEGKAFLRFVDEMKKVLPEGTSIFDDKVSHLKRFKWKNA